MAAAPADFRAAEVAPGKLAARGLPRAAPGADRGHPRRAGRRPRTEGQTIVGFAAEHGEGGVERARAKLERKGVDLIVLNDVSDATIGFESEENAVTLIDATRRDRRPAGVEGRDRRLDPRQGRRLRLRRLAKASGLY